MKQTRIIPTQAPRRQQVPMFAAQDTMPLFTGTPQTANAEKYAPQQIPDVTQDEIHQDVYKPVTGPPPVTGEPTADYCDIAGWTRDKLNNAYPGDYLVTRDGSLIVRVSWTDGLTIPDAITEIKHLYPHSEIHSTSHSKETHSARISMRVYPKGKDHLPQPLAFYLIRHQPNEEPTPADFNNAGTVKLTTLQRHRARVDEARVSDPTERHANPPKPPQETTQTPPPAAEPPDDAETPEIEQLIFYQREDINADHARNAYSGTSMDPERRGESVIRGYIVEMENLNAEYSQYVTDENREELKTDLERYRAGYLDKIRAKLAAQSRCMSTFITGPSNYPTRTQQKRHDTYGKRMNEQITYREKALSRLNKKYNPREIARGARIIRSDEGDPISRLQTKLEKLTTMQDLYKAANKIVRSKKLDKAIKICKLQELDGISEKTARQLLEPDFANRYGFAPYQLQNNNANMRRIRGRIADLERERDREEAADIELENGVIIRENTDITRMQLIFPGKPAAQIRDALKRHGFNWSRTEEAWQRLLNGNARYTVTAHLMDTLREYE